MSCGLPCSSSAPPGHTHRCSPRSHVDHVTAPGPSVLSGGMGVTVKNLYIFFFLRLKLGDFYANALSQWHMASAPNGVFVTIAPSGQLLLSPGRRPRGCFIPCLPLTPVTVSPSGPESCQLLHVNVEPLGPARAWGL